LKQPKKLDKKLWLWVLGWLFVFPVPLMLLVKRSNKIESKAKLGIVAASWIVYALVLIFVPRNRENKDNNSSDLLQVANSVDNNQNPINLKKTKNNNLNMDDSNVNTETSQPVTLDPTPTRIEAIKVTIEGDVSDLCLNENTVFSAIVEPEATVDKKVLWQTSNDEVAVVDEKGQVTAVGGGTATISAKTANGLIAEKEITVDETKRLFTLAINRDRVDHNNIGEEWSYDYYINGENVNREKEYIFKIGDQIKIKVHFEEDDDNPDIGEATKSYRITKEDIVNGFEVLLDLSVKENGGRYKGKRAEFTVKFSFK